MIRICLKPVTFIFFIAITFSIPLAAQNGHLVATHYLEQSGGYAPLYNGKIPPAYKQIYEGTYYLTSDVFYKGTVRYNGKFYTDVLLNLNAHLDELYIRMPQYYTSSILLKNHVSSFSLEGMEFIHITKEEWPGAPEEGYYQILYSGKEISILKKNEKKMKSKAAEIEAKASHYFSESIDYYVLRDGIFYPFKGKLSFLRILRDKRSVLNRYIRENKLKFSKEVKDASITLCAEKYEKILTQ
ncbi:MAG: hypothetical protein GX877_02670 [Bacteroidales bacterium]|nr:hypothetical protein [Bacteroidales bacterium]